MQYQEAARDAQKARTQALSFAWSSEVDGDPNSFGVYSRNPQTAYVPELLPLQCRVRSQLDRGCKWTLTLIIQLEFFLLEFE